MTALSQTTQQIVEKFFPPAQRPQVSQVLIEQCGNNLPMLENANEHDLERVRFAVIKISRGASDRFEVAVCLANTDWRDLLLEADFAFDLQAHETWAAEVLA